MSPRTLRAVIAATGAALPILASSHGAHAADPSVNVGAIEVVAVPDPAHLGVYPYAAGSLAFGFGPGSVIPSVGLEVCPELGHWGFVATVDVDVPLTPSIGFDVLVSAVHDQHRGDWSNATLSAGGGVGISLTLDQFVVSPSVSVLGGVNAPGWAIVPGINVSHGL